MASMTSEDMGLDRNVLLSCKNIIINHSWQLALLSMSAISIFFSFFNSFSNTSVD